MKAVKIFYMMIFTSWAASSMAACLENTFLGMNVDYLLDNYMGFDMGTSSGYSNPNASLVYAYDGACIGPASGTSHIVLKVDNQPCDLLSATLTSYYTAGVDQISGTERILNAVDLTTTLKFVNNPSTNINPDTVQFRFVARNVGSVTRYVALRLEIDTMVLGNDGTNISINNGTDVITTNTAWYKSSGNMPSNWWDYDVDPYTWTPNLVGRGHIKGNPYGQAATEPDIFEVANWNDVNGTAQWSLAPAGSPITYDSAVVYWWLNGNTPSSQGYALAAGQSITWIAYYGLNQGVMQFPTRTVTPSHTASPTASKTRTASPTFTLPATRTVSPTITVTPTISQTRTVTGTLTVTPSITATPTVTRTGTTTLTPTITPSFTATHTITPTITLTPTQVPCIITGLGTYPNPSMYDVNISYYLLKPCSVTVRIFSVSGELVLKKEEGLKPARNNVFNWNGRNSKAGSAASGTYIYKITADDTDGNSCTLMSKLSLAR